MPKPFRLTSLLFLFISCYTIAQTPETLRQKIQQIVSTRNAMVGVSIIANNGRDTISMNGDSHFPLQSVFKFHIAVVVLSQIDEGKLSLDQKIKIEKKDLLPGLYSPLRDKYPNGITLPISKLLSYSVSESDNVACDVLMKLVGGPKAVEDFFIKNNFKDISIKINEEVQQGNWDLQFQNWTTPKAASELLAAVYSNKTKLLSKKSYDLIWKIMKATKTGMNRLRGQIPKHTVVAHKTGTSGAREGLTAAVNDIGIVFLPGGKYFFISVFVTSSREDDKTNEKIVADIAKVAWDYFQANAK